MSGNWLESVDWRRCDRYFYALLLAIAALLLACWAGGRIGIETNMLALMPAAERDAVVAQASAQFDATLSRRHIALVGAPELPQARAAAQQLAASLRDSAAFADVRLQIDGDQQAEMAALYAPYRQRLLAEPMREQLLARGAAAATDKALATLYSPIAPLNSALLGADPLLLFYDFVTAQGAARGNVTLRDGLLVAQHEGWYYVLLQLQLRADPFSVAEQELVIPALDDAAAAVRAAFPQARVLDIGAVRYAAAGVNSARAEMETIGSASLVGVVLVLVLVFRSPLPMVASLVASAVGFAMALAVTWAWFGSIHLLTLVFGSSMLGIAIDHCLHFFADRMAAGPDWTAGATLRRIFAGVTVGLITTIIGYAGLYLTGFPGMQQIAVFSCAGLTGAYLTVIWHYPVWIKHPPGPVRGPWLRYSGQLLHALRPAGRRWPWLLVLPLAVVAVLGLLRLDTNDDIRALQPVSPALRQVEHEIRAITDVQAGTQFFLVEGATPAAVLAAEENLTAALRASIGTGALDDYDALTKQVPSPARQRDNLALLRGVLAERAVLTAYADAVGLDPAVLDDYAAAFEAAAALPDFDMQQWLASPAGQAWSHLWVGATERGFATLVTLHGVRDSAALEALEQGHPEWHFIDKAADFSSLFQRYRERAMVLIALAHALVFVFLWWRYGPLLGAAVMLPTALAAALTIAGLGWMGQQLNLFHLLALLLVLGIGIDYSLFLLEDAELNPATMLAILLSAIANELSFGLLAVSATPAVRAFGLTVFIGVAGAALLAPLIVDMKKFAQKKSQPKAPCAEGV